MRFFFTCLALAQLCVVASSAQSLSGRVLVVYNSANADSVSVAQHYQTARGINGYYMCGITPASTASVTWSEFDSTVRQPILSCLNYVGGRRILYIVLSSHVPYKIAMPHVFSVDSAIADIYNHYASAFPAAKDLPVRPHPYYAAAQSLGNVYTPFQSLLDYRLQPAAAVIYSVWRLDAATPALAKGLVDKAIQAERIGLSGAACFDRNRGDLTNLVDVGYYTGDWDIRRAADAAREVGYPTLEDSNWEEFGTSPAPPRCDGAALYAGWYSLNNYPDIFTWNPGAIGFHLDSASALDPRGGTNWTAKSVARGITITTGSVDEPDLDGLVHPDGFFRNLFEGANVGDAMLRNTQWLKWMNINTGDPLYRPFPAGRAPFNTGRHENALRIEPMALLGGASATGTVFLDAPAPAGGAVVTLTSSTASARTPASVTVPSGAFSASFSIATTRPVLDTFAMIQASYAGVSRRNSLMVAPLLGAITLRPHNVVIGGTIVEATIWLNGPAPAGGVAVTLQTDAAAAPVPVTVTVPAGKDRVKFDILTGAVSAKTVANITAAQAGTTRTVMLTVQPMAMQSFAITPYTLTAGQSSTATIAFNGPAPAGGVNVTVENLSAFTTSPAQVLVPAGSATVSFPVSTTFVNSTVKADVRVTAVGTSKIGTLTLYPAIVSVTVTPTPQMGGLNATLRVGVPFAAPAEGTAISLTSDDPGAATVPASVVVPAGAYAVNVPVITKSATAARNVTLTATASGYSRSVVLSVVPALIWSVAPPPTVKRGTPATGTVTLAGAAPAGGTTIALSSSNPSAAAVPASVTVPAGSTKASFTVTAGAVTANVPVTVTATCPHNSKTGATMATP